MEREGVGGKKRKNRKNRTKKRERGARTRGDRTEGTRGGKAQRRMNRAREPRKWTRSSEKPDTKTTMNRKLASVHPGDLQSEEEVIKIKKSAFTLKF